MGRIRRTFDIQFKIRICEAVESGLKTIPALCREYQLQRAVIEGWIKRYTRGELQGKVGNPEGELERENEKLRAKVGELTMQIDALKKLRKLQEQKEKENGWIVTSGKSDRKEKPARPVVLLEAPTTTARKASR